MKFLAYEFENTEVQIIAMIQTDSGSALFNTLLPRLLRLTQSGHQRRISTPNTLVQGTLICFLDSGPIAS